MKAKRMICLATFAAVTFASTAVWAETPKYVFFFLGDGMSNA